MQQATANAIYGGGPAAPLTAVGSTKAITAGGAVPSPDAGAAPMASSSPASVGDVMNDPTFWLVAAFGAMIALAKISK